MNKIIPLALAFLIMQSCTSRITGPTQVTVIPKDGIITLYFFRPGSDYNPIWPLGARGYVTFWAISINDKGDAVYDAAELKSKYLNNPVGSIILSQDRIKINISDKALNADRYIECEYNGDYNRVVDGNETKHYILIQ